ncbi:Protein phosphatase, putative [Hondaea fermentalgiana]|uniref:Protein phosphatase, putative n=1 Tax=Hondaea fermentalgiana TaxID=2315210 RepID=A0A2R5G6A2_9STRA|nr:Protein phosphatase, putative [Hondaea fermentalgiana]|eukprot:GBG26520.1 Protein phosphatase, putative [Hondaea fermentalgiana]
MARMGQNARRSLSRLSVRLTRKSQAETATAVRSENSSNGPRVRMGVASVPGRKRRMAARASEGLIVGNEDRVDVDRELGLTAVIDGHGGSLCADFLARHALERLREALSSRGLLEAIRRQSRSPIFTEGQLEEDSSADDDDDCEHDVDQLFSHENDEGDEEQNVRHASDAGLDESLQGVHDSLKETFAALEEEFREIWERTGETSGACALLSVVFGNMCVVAHCGDCRAVYRPASQRSHRLLRRSPTLTIQATDDHRTSSPAEYDRITDAGGVISNGRIDNLSPTRTFGDWDIKMRVGEGIVVAEPQVVVIPITSPVLIVLGTDGIWDSMPNKRVLDTAIRELNLNEGNYNKAAKALAKTATQGTNDDASCVLLHIEP